ncbi:MAG: hypothetical protein KA184_10385, partial [Candidatus Hydrogenedentes bacterium]|nr:hypothetical protein [Candidatus Hydrogenedentota bacterium]
MRKTRAKCLSCLAAAGLLMSGGLGLAAAQPSRSVRFHTADQDHDRHIGLSELLRVIQFYNSGVFHCDAGAEDGYAPGPGPSDCAAHASDYNAQDWRV